MIDDPAHSIAPAQGRSVWRALARGLRARCPACGSGRLFGAFLKVRSECTGCGQQLHHHRADDLPAYLVIFIVGHLVIPLVALVELAFQPPLWAHMLGWSGLVIAMSLALLQPVKGAVVGLQWALAMHGFGGDET